MTRSLGKRAMVLGVVLAIVGAACGSDADEGGSSAEPTEVSGDTDMSEVSGDTDTSGGADGAMAEAVEGYLTQPTELSVSEPVSQPPEPGKRIATLVCGISVCEQFADAYEEAGNEIGWTIERIALGTSPEEFAQGAQQAIESAPDAIVISGLGRAFFEQELAMAEEQGIPVLFWASTEPPVDGISASILGLEQYEVTARHLAEWVTVDSGGTANVAIFSVEQYVTTEAMRAEFQSHLEEICPDCKQSLQMVAASAIGVGMPGIATASLQSDPEIDYLFCGFGDLCTGVSAALKDAGHTLGEGGIKIFSVDGGTTQFQNIANGEEHLTAPLPISMAGWHIIDTLQRIFNGDEVVNTMPIQIITAAGIDDPNDLDTGAVEGFRDRYRELWMV